MAESTQWRVYITANNGATNFTGVAELEMSDEEGGANLCTGGNPIASSEHGTFGKDRAFDGIRDNSTYGWITATNQVAPAWIGYEFAEAVQIREFRITSNDDGLGGNDEPRDFVLQYFDDAQSDWVSVENAEYTGETGWTNYEERTYVGDLSSPINSIVTGKCVRGNANLPAHREIYAYSQLDGTYLGFAETDEFGDFTLSLNGDTAVFLRIVDPGGIYSTEIRENIMPVIIVTEE